MTTQTYINGTRYQQECSKTVRNEIILECRKIFFPYFESILSLFFENIDDQLFALSDKAESSTLQALYFDAMRYVRMERDEAKRKYLSEIKTQYDSFWKNSDAPNSKLTQKQEDENSLELVENEILEEDLAVTTMAEKNNNLFYRELYDLNIRFAALAGETEVDNDTNPLAPARLCGTFESVLIPLTLDLRVKLVIYKLFDTLVLSHLGRVYNELNAALITVGFSPLLPEKPIGLRCRNAMVKSAIENPIRTAPENSQYDAFVQSTDSASIEAFQTIQMLLGNWRSQLQVLQAERRLDLLGSRAFLPIKLMKFSTRFRDYNNRLLPLHKSRTQPAKI